MKAFKTMSALAALLMFLPAFVSCDKDDDKDDPTVAAAILGTYTGSLDYSVMGYEPGNIGGEYDLKIMKDPTDADDVMVVLPQCTFTPPIGDTAFTIPSLAIDDVDVTEKGGRYTISEDDFSVKVGDVVYTGRLTGTIEGKSVKAEYIVRPGRMPMDINFTFTGTLK